MIGPKLVVKIPTTRLIPTKPIPIVSALRTALPTGTLNMIAKIKIAIGKITVGPKTYAKIIRNYELCIRFRAYC